MTTDPNADKVLDYFLEEFLSKQRPPDLSARIQAAWQLERELAEGRSDTAGPAVVGTREVVGVVERVPVQPELANWPRSKGTRQPRLGASSRRNAVALSLALAACGLLAILGWRLQSRNDDPGERTALRTEASFVDAGDLPIEHALAHQRRTRPMVAAEANGGGVDPQVLDIADVPFDLGSLAENDTAARTAMSSRNDVVRLPAQEIVARLNERLQSMWQQLEIRPTEHLSPAAHAQRIAQLLTATNDFEPTETEIAAVIANRLQSSAFADTWSQKFVQLWFARGSVPLDSQLVKTVRAQIAAHIRASRPWSEIPQLLLGGDIAADMNSSDATATTTFVGALAGNGNRRLIERIGQCFLNVNLSCIRCHDARLENAEPFESQATYWSTLALLQGVDARGNGARGERLVSDRQTDKLASEEATFEYFDLLDGRLQVAEAKLPDGADWRSLDANQLPRQSLAEWIGRSRHLDEATVNQVWTWLLGEPLVPLVEHREIAGEAVGPGEAVAYETRLQMQRFLATQFRAHGNDLRQLVQWIVQCEAVALAPARLTESQWMLAEESELREQQLRRLTFAAFPDAPLGSESDPLEAKLLIATRASARRGLDAEANQRALAQPSTAVVKPSASRKGTQGTAPQAADRNLPAGALSFLVERPTVGETRFVDRLLDSKRLRWEDCVEHVMGLSPTGASGRAKHLADELLRQHAGDTRAALLDVLWAVKQSRSLQ